MINESHPPTDSNWAIEFSKKFSNNIDGYTLEEDIKSFIQNLIQSEREKEREKWISQIKKLEQDTDDLDENENYGYGIAFNRVLDILSSNKPSNE